MKKNNGIRSKFVKEALIDSFNLSKSIQENTKKTIEELLKEEVKNEFKNLMNEAIDDEDEEEEDIPDVSEVEDTVDADTSDSDNNSQENNDAATDDNSDATEAGMEDDNKEIEKGEGTDETPIEGDSTETDEDDSLSTDSKEGDDWDEFNEFKVSDNEYDFSKEEDGNFVKIYKLLTPDDQVRVLNNGDKIQIKDTENGSEYMIDLSAQNDNAVSDDSVMENKETNMNEENQLIYEMALDEYNSNVGYTDSYQKDDVVTNDGVKEPGKNVNDWDKGVPKDTKKPWGNPVKKEQPFNKAVSEGCNENSEEEIVNEEEEANIEEANLSQSRWNDTHAAHNRVPAANKDEYRRNGIQKTSKGTKYRANGTSDEAAALKEDLKRMAEKANEIFKENNELKASLNEFKKLIEQCLVENINLGNTVKLFMNNSTTITEKRNIIDRFKSEAHTIDESNKLYEKINKELKNKSTTLVNENIDKQYNADGSKRLNETKISEDKSLLKMLDLNSRLNKY